MKQIKKSRRLEIRKCKGAPVAFVMQHAQLYLVPPGGKYCNTVNITRLAYNVVRCHALRTPHYRLYFDVCYITDNIMKNLTISRFHPIH